MLLLISPIVLNVLYFDIKFILNPIIFLILLFCTNNMETYCNSFCNKIDVIIRLKLHPIIIIIFIYFLVDYFLSLKRCVDHCQISISLCVMWSHILYVLKNTMEVHSLDDFLHCIIFSAYSPQFSNNGYSPFSRGPGDGALPPPDGRLRAVHLHRPALGLLWHQDWDSAH